MSVAYMKLIHQNIMCPHLNNIELVAQKNISKTLNINQQKKKATSWPDFCVVASLLTASISSCIVVASKLSWMSWKPLTWSGNCPNVSCLVNTVPTDADCMQCDVMVQHILYLGNHAANFKHHSVIFVQKYIAINKYEDKYK